MIGEIAQALASIYGYNTINRLIAANSGLIVILIAFIVVGLVFYRLLNQQFPRTGRQPVRIWIFKTVITFMICAFVFICGFTVFYEKKKLDKHGGVIPSSAYKTCLYLADTPKFSKLI